MSELTEMTQPMEFDCLERIEVPVRLNGESYVLTETLSSTFATYRNKITRQIRLSIDGKSGASDGVAEADLFLLSQNLFKTDSYGSRFPVEVDTIRAWPTRITQPLFRRLELISGLKEQAENGTPDKRKEEAKNSSPATT